ncbi:T9SS type A sorting domain-containing protein [bacterium]|nr:T9SS type A sorting domain-containing protein [bacterium]
MLLSLYHLKIKNLFIILIFSSLLLRGQKLIVQDALKDSTTGLLQGAGIFLTKGGWRSAGGKIIFDAGHIIKNGYFEATMRGWTAPAQGVKKSHPLAGWEIKDQYTRMDQQGSYFNWRIGSNYNPFKVLAKPIAGGARLEEHIGTNSMVNDGKPDVYRVEWNDARVTFSLDGITLISWQLSRFQLQYFTIGKDDWYELTNPAPVISDVIIVDRDLPSSDTLMISTQSLVKGRYLEFYSDTLKTDRDNDYGQWLLLNDSLPGGLNFDIETGIIQGTPKSSGIYHPIVCVRHPDEWVAGDTTSLLLEIENQKPVYFSADTAQVRINELFAYTIRTKDPDGHSVQLQCINYPSWISLTDSTAHGTAPDVPQDTSITWIASDGDLSDTMTVIIHVLPKTVNIQSDIFPDGYYLAPYSYQFTATGGVPPYHWEINSTLPRGLLFDPDSMKIRGTPLESGTFSIRLQVQDSWTPAYGDTTTLILRIKNQAPQISLPDTIVLKINEDLTIPVSGSDPDGHPVILSLVERPSWLTLTDSMMVGTTPSEGQAAMAVLQITDGDLTSNHTIHLLVYYNPSDMNPGQSAEPVNFDLRQNFPNPMNPETVIGFSVAERCHVTLSLFNAKGQRVRCLADCDFARGYYQKHVKASSLAAGVYYYTIQMKDYYAVKKLVLIK